MLCTIDPRVGGLSRLFPRPDLEAQPCNPFDTPSSVHPSSVQARGLSYPVVGFCLSVYPTRLVRRRFFVVAVLLRRRVSFIVARRQFIIAGIGTLTAGCSQAGRLATGRPGPMWPRLQNAPHADGQAYALPQRPEPIVKPKRVGPIDTIARSRWAKSKPISTRLRSMGSIQRITVHHEGWTPVWFDDVANTSQRLESIRRSHLERLRAGKHS